MERLEAALEKARESRRVTQVEATKEQKPAEKAAPLETKPSERWLRVKEMKMSPLSARKNRIWTLKPGAVAGPHDMLRSRATRLMGENGWTSLAVTSPNAACGKTTIVANLAFSLARQVDKKIMVVDFDLRRPSLHKVLSQKPAHSFHQVLEGSVRVEDQLVRYGDNLIFALNSTPATRPSELLQSTDTRNRLAKLRDDYQPDIILFDLPPMLASDDNVGFLPQVDCAILVNAAESTTLKQLDNCEKELASLTNVLGVVLNKCRFKDRENGYDGDYYY